MRLALATAVLALAACSPPAERRLVLPGLLDLDLAAGDEVRLCSADGVTDTTPTMDCVLGPAENAFAPYAQALRAMGWTERGDVWLGPPTERGRRCLIVTASQTNFTRRERTVIEFSLREEGSADPRCAP